MTRWNQFEGAVRCHRPGCRRTADAAPATRRRRSESTDRNGSCSFAAQRQTPDRGRGSNLRSQSEGNRPEWPRQSGYRTRSRPAQVRLRMPMTVHTQLRAQKIEPTYELLVLAQTNGDQGAIVEDELLGHQHFCRCRAHRISTALLVDYLLGFRGAIE